MKEILFKNWHVMRLVKLGLGMLIFIQGIVTKDWTTMILGLLFSALPLFNIECCGGGSCNINRKA